MRKLTASKYSCVFIVDAISTVNDEKVVNAAQNPPPAAKKRRLSRDLVKSPTITPNAADPEILIRTICQGQWVIVGRSSRIPHLDKAPIAPPKKTAKNCLLLTSHDGSAESRKYYVHYVDGRNATTATYMGQYVGGRI